MIAVAEAYAGPARPKVAVEVLETGWTPWFEWAKAAHYLPDAGRMPFSTAYTGFDLETGDPVVFMGMSGMWAGNRRAARACRLVVAPEWQGAGVGLRFLDALADREWRGEGFIGEPTPTYFHTAHPALCAALRRSKRWNQTSQTLVGDEKGVPNQGKATELKGAKFGGHWRSVAGFKYEGEQ